MRRINRYISKTIYSHVIMILLILLSLDFIFSLIGEMEDLDGNYQISDVLKYAMSTIPRRIYEQLPMVALIASLTGLGSLASNSELVVLRAAGVSLNRICLSTMKPIMWLMVAGLVLGEYIVPNTESYAKSERAVAQGGDGPILSKHGRWYRDKKNNSFLHFNAIHPNGELYGITRYQFNDNKELIKTAFAKRAIYQQQQKHWVLYDVVISELLAEGSRSYEQLLEIWTTEVDPQLLSIEILEPEYLSTSGLYAYSVLLQQQELDPGEYQVAFWKKALQPFSTLVLVLVGISFIFGPLREVTMGLRVTCGLVTGFMFDAIQDLLGPASRVFGFSPFWSSFIPILLCLVLGLILLQRTR